MSKLKNIIFDLGNVLLDIDFELTIQAFRNLGFPHFEHMYSLHEIDTFFEKFEKGQVTVNTFYEVLGKIGKEGISKDEITQAWNTMLLEFRMESLQHLNQLKDHYRLFLLSNTNPVHLEKLAGIFEKHAGDKRLDDYFEKSYYSHLIGKRKPDPEIYNYIIRDTGINPEESLFIDDLEENVVAAKKAGLQVHHLLKGERIEKLDFSRLKTLT